MYNSLHQLGSEFSKNLETMVKEIQNCFEDKPNWENYIKNLNLPEDEKVPEVFVSILPKCDWLIPVELELAAPLEVEAIEKLYEAYYCSRPKNSNKSLTWDYFYGRIEAKFKHVNSFFYIVCRPYQYTVLKLFEKAEKLSFEDIRRRICLPKKQEHHLISIMKSFVSLLR